MAVAVAAASGVAPAHRLPRAPRCPIFPASNSFNQRVDSWPVVPNSGVLVRSIGLDAHAHPDFGSGRYAGRPIGIPFDVVGRHTPRSRVSFDYASESDRVGYPIPRGSTSRAARTATPCSWTAMGAGSTSSSRWNAGGEAGTPARAPSSTCARTGCARAAGPRPTPPACRSSRVSPVPRISAAAAWTMRCASRRRRPAAPSSSPRGTSRRTRMTRASRPWVRASASSAGSRRAASAPRPVRSSAA